MKYRTDEWHSLKKRPTGADILLFEEPQTGCLDFILLQFEEPSRHMDEVSVLPFMTMFI